MGIQGKKISLFAWHFKACPRALHFILLNVSTKKINTIATNCTSAVSINCHGKKVRDCCKFVCSFISDHISIDNYYLLYAKQKGTI